MPALLSQSNKFMATGALILSVLAVLLVVAMRTTPCANAQSGSCTVGAMEVFASGITVNEDGNDADTRMESDTEENMFYLDAGNNRIGLGTSSPSVFFDIQGITSFGDNNITNVGDIAVDSISADGASISIANELSMSDLNVTNVGDISLDSISADGSVVVINEAGLDEDFRIESEDDVDAFRMRADRGTFAYGATPASAARLTFGTYTTDVGTILNNVAQLALTGVLTNDTSGGAAVITHINAAPGGTVTADNAGEVLARITTAYFGEPVITLSGTDTVTDTATVWVANAPTEGSNDYAIYMPSGAFGVSDGAGSGGEQLQSGGAGANVIWAAAASVRSSKTGITENTDAAGALDLMITTPVYNFTYKTTEYETITETDSRGNEFTWTRPIPGKRFPSTGDFDTTYVGIMADEAPWAMHFDGKILNPISTFGYTVLAFQALEARVKDLEVRLAALEAK